MNNNQSLVKVNNGLLSALSKGFISLDVFPKETLVLECLVAGTSYRKLENVRDQLKESIRLEMKREGYNEFDSFAISLWFRDTKVGYIPREENEVIARLMDAGKQFFAIIAAKKMKGNWLKLEIRVTLKE